MVRLTSILSFSVSALSFALPAMCMRDPPEKSITIGKGGMYSTLTEALKHTSSNVYFVYAGTYKDRPIIDRPNVKIYGQTPDPMTYASNQVTFANNVPSSRAGSNDASGTIRVHAEGVSLHNLNIANTYGKPEKQSQAIALSVQAGQFGCYACNITGNQDTLLADKGTQFYGKCYIEGAVDFIFGAASIWITGSTINTIGNGHITASARDSNDNSYFVIDSSVIKGKGDQYLGRPWRRYARVVVQNTKIGPHILPAGWSQWSDKDKDVTNVVFREYKNSGGGAWREGRKIAKQLSSAIKISEVLSSTNWIEPAFL